MTTSTYLPTKDHLSDEKIDTYYIEREAEREFFEEFENSLVAGKAEKPSKPEKTEESSEKPFLFLIDGMGGIGKHVLIEKLKQRTAREFKEAQQAKPNQSLFALILAEQMHLAIQSI